MNTVFCNLQPFDMVQQVYVINDKGKVMDNFTCSFDDMIETIPMFCKDNQINKIYLVGITDYVCEVKNRMLEFCKSNYGYETLNLDIECGD